MNEPNAGRATIRFTGYRGQDVTDTLVYHHPDCGWQIQWENVPKAELFFHLNLCHPAFMRKKPYTTKTEALLNLAEALGKPPYGERYSKKVMG